jgi:hypothetical protein
VVSSPLPKGDGSGLDRRERVTIGPILARPTTPVELSRGRTRSSRYSDRPGLATIEQA